MKVEIAESLMMSWLKHVKNCQLVQLNWKPSVSSWELYNQVEIENIAKRVDEYFEQHHQLDLFKKNSSVSQLLQQGEIDVLGTNLNRGTVNNLYAIDIAFHENGLNYGSKEETITRIIKKMIRSVLLIYGYFNINKGEVIFASPKVTDLIIAPLSTYLKEVEQLLNARGLNFKLTLLFNEDFNDQVYSEVISKVSSVADTSELFMRALQLSSLVTTYKPKLKELTIREANSGRGLNNNDELKIGIYVREHINELIKTNKLSAEEVQKLQQQEYSKRTFNINHPMLKVYDKEVDLASQRNVSGYPRYYKDIYHINGKAYLMCNWIGYTKLDKKNKG